MGWKCNNCGNTQSFTEVNTVNTAVTQEKGTTKILRIGNIYRGEAAMNVWCNKCDSEDVCWVDVPDQDTGYMNQ